LRNREIAETGIVLLYAWPLVLIFVCVCVRMCAFQTKTKQNKKRRMDKNVENADKQSFRPKGTSERQG